MRLGEFSEGVSRPTPESTVATDFGSARVSPEGYISNLVVNASHRGNGKGHELLSAVTKHADEHGLTLNAHVREDLHPFYAGHGFQVSHFDEAMGSPVLHRKPR